MYHLLRGPVLVFLCIADAQFDRQDAFQFLEACRLEVKTTFLLYLYLSNICRENSMEILYNVCFKCFLSFCDEAKKPRQNFPQRPFLKAFAKFQKLVHFYAFMTLIIHITIFSLPPFAPRRAFSLQYGDPSAPNSRARTAIPFAMNTGIPTLFTHKKMMEIFRNSTEFSVTIAAEMRRANRGVTKRGEDRGDAGGGEEEEEEKPLMMGQVWGY